MIPAAEHPLVAQIRTQLSRHTPTDASDSQARPAAVAIVVQPRANDLSILFIVRAEYASDPWSGQVAFPGGRREDGDADLLATAVRETAEETGVDLAGNSQLLGRLDDLQSRNIRLPDIFVRPFVLAVGTLPPFQLSSEVAEAFWIPLSVLKDELNWRSTTVSARGSALEVSACHFEGRVIWGMTERILSQLLSLCS